MFGVPNSIKILKKIAKFIKNDKNKKKYRVVITPPYTLVESYTKNFKNSNLLIGAQNCFHKDFYSSDTGAVSAFMLKKVNAKYIIVGHSDNRKEGDNDKVLKKKVLSCLSNNLRVIFCIGENLKQKKKNLTIQTLRNQLKAVLDPKVSSKKLIIAYEPIWSIGTGLIPKKSELANISFNIKSILKKLLKTKKAPPILYGGSVDDKNIHIFKNLSLIDGFLIGSASKSSKKFIDIIKNYYR